jgi:hypothetical protein
MKAGLRHAESQMVSERQRVPDAAPEWESFDRS